MRPEVKKIGAIRGRISEVRLCTLSYIILTTYSYFIDKLTI